VCPVCKRVAAPATDEPAIDRERRGEGDDETDDQAAPEQRIVQSRGHRARDEQNDDVVDDFHHDDGVVAEKSRVPDAALELGFYRFTEGTLFGVPAVISRTGYTGEDGFELYFNPQHAATVWDGLMAAGTPHGLELVGLGARDSLRLEMAYMLYGNDLDDTTTPLEAGLAWTVKLAKPDFTGKGALLAQKEKGMPRKLVGIEAEGRRVPRHGMAVEVGGRSVGVVTSGGFAPSLEKAIALAYVEPEVGAIGSPVSVAAGSTSIPARIVKRPFYTQGSHK